MRMWEEVGTQLKGFADAMREFGADMRDVRERMIRIEAQDQPAKIAKLEDALAEAHDEIARVERESELALAAAVSSETAERTKVITEHAKDKLALEKRLTRMEVIIAPLTAIGSALIAAIAGIVATGHFH
jgi:hypothetical protein